MHILYGSSKVAAYYKKAFNAETFNLNGVKDPSEANGKRSNIVNCVDDEVKVEIGKETEDSDMTLSSCLTNIRGKPWLTLPRKRRMPFRTEARL